MNYNTNQNKKPEYFENYTMLKNSLFKFPIIMSGLYNYFSLTTKHHRK